MSSRLLKRESKHDGRDDQIRHTNLPKVFDDAEARRLHGQHDQVKDHAGRRPRRRDDRSSAREMGLYAPQIEHCRSRRRKREDHHTNGSEQYRVADAQRIERRRYCKHESPKNQRMCSDFGHAVLVVHEARQSERSSCPCHHHVMHAESASLREHCASGARGRPRQTAGRGAGGYSRHGRSSDRRRHHAWLGAPRGHHRRNGGI